MEERLGASEAPMLECSGMRAGGERSLEVDERFAEGGLGSGVVLKGLLEKKLWS